MGKQLCAAVAEYAAPGYGAKKAYDLHRFSNNAKLPEVKEVVKGNFGTVMSEKQITSVSRNLHSALTSKLGRGGSLVVTVTLAGQVVTSLIGDLPDAESPPSKSPILAIEKPSSIVAGAVAAIREKGEHSSPEE